MKLTDIFMLINPHSGKKKSVKLVSILHKKFADITFHVSKTGQEATSVLAENLDKFTVFILAGGDGTVNLVIPFFVNRKDKILAVYPMGSGNGFALELGFTKNLDRLIDCIVKGKTTDIDILRCNDNLAINMAGIGLDGYIAELFRHQKKRGLIKYAILTTKALFHFKPFDAVIQAGSQTFSETCMGIVLANTRQFGNHAYISPDSDPSDGKTGMVLIKKMPFLHIILFFIRLFTKGIKNNTYITCLQTSAEIFIRTEYTFAHVDGEPFSINGSLDVRLLPAAVRVIKNTE